MGLQNIGSYFAVFCQWLLAIPLAIVLGIKMEFGVMGLQGGFAIAITVQCIAYLTILMSKDWQQVADEA